MGLERGTAAAVALIFYAYPAVIALVEVVARRELDCGRARIAALVLAVVGQRDRRDRRGRRRDHRRPACCASAVRSSCSRPTCSSSDRVLRAHRLADGRDVDRDRRGDRRHASRASCGQLECRPVPRAGGDVRERRRDRGRVHALLRRARPHRRRPAPPSCMALEAVIGIVLGAIFLDESVKPIVAIGGVAILAGAVLAAARHAPADRAEGGHSSPREAVELTSSHDAQHDAGLPADDHGDLAPRAPGVRRQRVRHVDRCGPTARDLRRGRRQRGPAGGRADEARCRRGDRVGTFCWNTQEHLEAYFAIPCMGAVLHTLNIRLFPEQLAYVINHGEDQSRHRRRLADPRARTRRRRSRDGRDGSSSSVTATHRRSATARCCAITSSSPRSRRASTIPSSTNGKRPRCVTRRGRPGNPKGVAYSHRSSYLHSLVATTPTALGLSERDRVLTIVPMFHANAWGIPYASFICGASS